MFLLHSDYYCDRYRRNKPYVLNRSVMQFAQELRGVHPHGCFSNRFMRDLYYLLQS
ncbi:MAG: hypothetical protein JWP67_138 [Mucilaginibacter sp.]|nr:hypothetical protein [Mucilaginibacter sp.]